MRTGRENGWLCLAYSMKMAGVTGLEPAASGVTGRRSNQLSYTPVWGSGNGPEGGLRRGREVVEQAPLTVKRAQA